MKHHSGLYCCTPECRTLGGDSTALGIVIALGKVPPAPPPPPPPPRPSPTSLDLRPCQHLSRDDSALKKFYKGALIDQESIKHCLHDDERNAMLTHRPTNRSPHCTRAGATTRCGPQTSGTQTAENSSVRRRRQFWRYALFRSVRCML